MTVSRVLEDSGKVAEGTRARVVAAMEKLGYFGNAAATQLVSGRTQTVGVVTSNVADYGYGSTIRGIERRARERGMSILIAVIEGDSADDRRRTVATVAAHALAGVVILDFDDIAHAVVPAMPDYLPTVSTTRPINVAESRRPHVFIDDHLGAVSATEHLIELGHRTVFLLAQPNYDATERRAAGTLETLTRANLPHYPVLACDSWRPDSGYRAALELLSNYGDDVTAIACGNDEIALGAVRALSELGLRVPEDVSVVGFDDNPMAAFTTPAITTVAQDFTALGAASFDLLDALLSDSTDTRPPPLVPSLIVRESTAPPNPNRGLGRSR